MMHSLNEIALIPSIISNVKHRREINPYTKDKVLPIFVAPMTCIINQSNIDCFAKNGLIPIIPVSTKDGTFGRLWDDGRWTALTLDQFNSWFCEQNAYKGCKYKILIDCANGQMEQLFCAVQKAKKYYSALQIMIGNIANPLTYFDCCKTGVDYVRVGIGGGSGCTTSVQTGIHASLPFLLKWTKRFKRVVTIWNKMFHTCTVTKIVADGGVNTIDKAVKCLALGADYVMMGKCLAQCEESCGSIHKRRNKYYKKYYGQSSEQGQLDRFGKIKSQPEGTIVFVPVTGTIKDFVNTFEASLRTAMSYCNAFTLEDFIGKVHYEIQSTSEYESYMK